MPPTGSARKVLSVTVNVTGQYFHEDGPILSRLLAGTFACVKLAAYVAALKRRTLEELQAGLAPSEGRFDKALLAEARRHSTVNIGATTLAPWEIKVEFVFSEPGSMPVIVPVSHVPRERIVALCVPDWVVMNVWQGQVDGSFEYESDAYNSLEAYRATLAPDANETCFGPKPPVGKE